MRAFALICLLPLAAMAATPVAVTHSGYLIDATDAAVSQPNMALGFSLWADATGSGSRLWPAGATDSACVADVTNGYYTVLLDGASSGCGAGLTAELLDPTQERFLQVAVDGVTLLPRSRLAGAPTARLSTKSQDTQALIASLAAPGTVNGSANPVDWTQLKNVPPGLADGTDDGNVYAADGTTIALNAGTFSVKAGGIHASQLALDPAAFAQISGGAVLLDLAGNLSVGGNVTLTAPGARFTGNGSGLTAVDADMLEGATKAQIQSGVLGNVTGLVRGNGAGVAQAATSADVVAALGFTPANAFGTSSAALTPVTNATLLQAVTSNALTVPAGPVSVVVLGDASATLLRNGSAVGKAGVFQANDALAIGLTSAGSYNTTTSAVVVFGTNTAAWTVTTANGATGLAFVNVVNASANTDVTSNAATLGGFSGQLTATVAGDATAVLVRNGTNTGAQTTSVAPGDTLAVRLHTGALNTSQAVTVTVGISSATWTVTVPNCIPGSQTYTGPTTFDFTVPTGCRTLTVDAYGGGGGGNSVLSLRGGRGAHVTHTFSVNPGALHHVQVAGGGGVAGFRSSPGAAGQNGGGAGGGGGGSGYGGGGGGGVTAIFALDGTTPLVAAAGGGGSSGDTGNDAFNNTSPSQNGTATTGNAYGVGGSGGAGPSGTAGGGGGGGFWGGLGTPNNGGPGGAGWSIGTVVEPSPHATYGAAIVGVSGGPGRLTISWGL